MSSQPQAMIIVRLQNDLLTAGKQVEQAMQQLAQAIPGRSAVVDTGLILDTRVELATLRALTQYHATDLDQQCRLAVTLKIGDYLGSMAALTLDLVQRSRRLAQVPTFELPTEFSHVAELVASMVRLALEAYVDREVRVARHLAQLDQEVDRYCQEMVAQLVGTMKAMPEQIPAALTLYGALRHLAALAQLSTEVAACVVQLVDGETLPRRVTSW